MKSYDSKPKSDLCRPFKCDSMKRFMFTVLLVGICLMLFACTGTHVAVVEPIKETVSHYISTGTDSGSKSKTSTQDCAQITKPDGDERIPNGCDMKTLQSLLKNAGYDPKGIDGKCGPGTRKAIKSFQTAQNLSADGIPTRSLIYRLQCLQKQTVVAHSSSSPSIKAKGRTQSQMDQLFNKGVATGSELVNELFTIKQAALASDTQNAFDNLIGVIDDAGTDKKIWDFNFKTISSQLTQASMNWVQSLLREKCQTINYQALTGFFNFMLEGDGREILDRESINLPAQEGLTSNQQQRVLYIAAFTIAARIANQVADEAQNSLENLENEYKDLLIHRQKIATVLAEVIARRDKAKRAKDELEFRQRTDELRKYLSQEDIEFIDSFAKDRTPTVAEISNDFAMQNLAIKFLRSQNPEKYRNYRAKVDRLVGKTRIAVKTAGGAIAFGGLVTSFIHEVSCYGDIKTVTAVFGSFKLGVEFLKEAAALGGKVAQTALTGIVLESDPLFGGPRRFRVLDTNSERNDYRKSSDVFSLIKKENKTELFTDAFFSEGGRGLLLTLYRSDPDTLGRMLDTSIPDTMRNDFGINFMGKPDTNEYSFVNALTDLNTENRERVIHHLLEIDQRKQAQYQIVGNTQLQVCTNFSEWNNRQFTRLILANHHGSIEFAQMHIGNMIVRLVPTMTAVYEYECYMDTLIKHSRSS